MFWINPEGWLVGVWDGDCWDLSQQFQTSSQHNPNRRCSIKLPVAQYSSPYFHCPSCNSLNYDHTKLYYCAISIQRNVIIIEDIVLLAIGESVEILHKSNIFSSGTTNSPNWVWHVKIAPFLWNMAARNLNILLENLFRLFCYRTTAFRQKKKIF